MLRGDVRKGFVRFVIITYMIPELDNKFVNYSPVLLLMIVVVNVRTPILDVTAPSI